MVTLSVDSLPGAGCDRDAGLPVRPTRRGLGRCSGSPQDTSGRSNGVRHIHADIRRTVENANGQSRPAASLHLLKRDGRRLFDARMAIHCAETRAQGILANGGRARRRERQYRARIGTSPRWLFIGERGGNRNRVLRWNFIFGGRRGVVVVARYTDEEDSSAAGATGGRNERWRPFRLEKSAAA